MHMGRGLHKVIMSNQFNGKPETTITVPLTDSVASCNSVNDYIYSVS